MSPCSNPNCKNYSSTAKELCWSCWLDKRDKWLKKLDEEIEKEKAKKKPKRGG